MRNYQLYNVVGIFAGPSPSSGFHFLTFDSVLNNRYDVEVGNINLLFSLNRINQVTYGFTAPRNEIKSLGNRATLDRPILNPPEVQLSISYAIMGLINEARLGFMFNRPDSLNYHYDPNSLVLSNLTGSEVSLNGLYVYDTTRTAYVQSGNSAHTVSGDGLNWIVNPPANYYTNPIVNKVWDQTGWSTYLGLGPPPNVDRLKVWGSGYLYGSGYVCPISGLVDRKLNLGSETAMGFPLTTREPRNIFIGCRKDNLDFNTQTGTPTVDNTNLDVISFGDCYITNYKTSCSVNNIPSVTVEFVANNIESFGNTSGCSIPAVDPKTLIPIQNKKFNLPNPFQGTGLPTVILPRDVSLSITNLNNLNPTGYSVDFNDIKIQSYEINIPLNREPLYALGYKLPLDRRIIFPAIVNLVFDIIVGDNQSGSLSYLMRNDDKYNIGISVNYQPNQSFAGTALRYDFFKARFNNMNFNHSTSQHKIATLSYNVEMDTENTSQGFFMSGQLGIPTGGLTDSILLGDDFLGLGTINELLLTAEGNRLLLSSPLAKILF